MKHSHAILTVSLLATTFALLAAAEPPPPMFIVSTVGGDAVRGSFHELKADWALRIGDKALTVNDFVSIRRVNGKLPPFPVGQQLIFANGDRLPIKLPRLVGEKLHFQNPDFGDGMEVPVPLSAVSVLWLTAPDNVEYSDLLRRQLAMAVRMRDQVLLRNGDTVDGLFNALDKERVEIEVDKKAIEVKLDKVSAIVLSSDGATKLTPKGVYARVVLTDGTRLSLAAATCSDGVTLHGSTLFGASFRAPLSRIATLDLRQGAAVYLSELKPVKFEQTSYLGDSGVKWPLAIDAAVSGRDLRLGGSVYDTGLGMHTRTRATYALDGKYRRFEGVVGMDDETGRDGSARIRVLADGKPLEIGNDTELTTKNGPIVVNVKIVGVKELTLEADFGRRGDVQGHVNWGEARVVK